MTRARTRGSENEKESDKPHSKFGIFSIRIVSFADDGSFSFSFLHDEASFFFLCKHIKIIKKY